MLTDKQVAALKPKSARYEIWDGEGFGVRVTPRGAKSFVWMYRHQGVARRMTLGTYNPPHFGVADAHIRLAHARKLHKDGKDPGRALVEEKRAHRRAETVGELIDAFLRDYSRPHTRKRTADEHQRILEKDVRPYWGKRKAKDITRRDVLDRLKAVKGRGATVTVNRTQSVISRMFRFAVQEEIIEISPCREIERVPEKPRDRVLSEDEIRAAWAAFDAYLDPTIARALKLILSTGARNAEACGLADAELDYFKREWLLPAERSKSKREHLVPLSPLALSILAECELDKRGWYFPSPRSGGHILSNSVDHALRDLFVLRDRDRSRRKGARQSAKTPPLAGKIEPFTPHDLRRTAATLMREAGVPRDTVKACLNHKATGVTAEVYDKYDMLAEKAEAMNVLSARLEFIVSRGANVIEAAQRFACAS